MLPLALQLPIVRSNSLHFSDLRYNRLTAWMFYSFLFLFWLALVLPQADRNHYPIRGDEISAHRTSCWRGSHALCKTWKSNDHLTRCCSDSGTPKKQLGLGDSRSYSHDNHEIRRLFRQGRFSSVLTRFCCTVTTPSVSFNGNLRTPVMVPRNTQTAP